MNDLSSSASSCVYCPLCRHDDTRPSWLGSTVYRGAEFVYMQCLSCGSLFCDPMPDEDVLAQMYGDDYQSRFADDPMVEDPRQPLRVVDWLKRGKAGTFLDYGCGNGAMLTQAAKLNWRAIGVEFDDEVAKTVEKQTGLEVVGRSSDLLDEPLADILHLGDVVEHLTDIEDQMPEILRLIKPGGLLLAQGPLEANSCLFTMTLSVTRSLRRRKRATMAPYHVLLATAHGQRVLFRRFRLEELEYSVHEVSWPAPTSRSFSELKTLRLAGLFLARRFSQAFSKFVPGWGNRYFYVGRWSERSWYKRGLST